MVNYDNSRLQRRRERLHNLYNAGGEIVVQDEFRGRVAKPRRAQLEIVQEGSPRDGFYINGNKIPLKAFEEVDLDKKYAKIDVSKVLSSRKSRRTA